MPLLFVMWSLSFGATNSSFRVFPLLKCTCMPYVLQIFLKLSFRPLLYGTVIKLLLMVLVLLSLLLFLAVLGVLFFNFILLMAQVGICNLIKLCLCVVKSFEFWENTFRCSRSKQWITILSCLTLPSALHSYN